MDNRTGDSLYAAWEARGPSNPLPPELLALCLLFLSSVQRTTVQTAVCARSAPRVDTGTTQELPPPQRFQRRIRIVDRPPPGPTKAHVNGNVLSMCQGIERPTPDGPENDTTIWQ